MPLFPVFIRESREVVVYVDAADQDAALDVGYQEADDILADEAGDLDVTAGQAKEATVLGDSDEVWSADGGSYTAEEYRELLVTRRKITESAFKPLQKEQLPLGLDESVPV